MNASYPPGVTGNEPEIVGHEPIDWDLGSFEPTGKTDDYTLEGTVTGQTKTDRYTAPATKCCGEIEVDEDSAEWEGEL